MYVYLVSEDCHGLLGVFSSVENGINFLKKEWDLSDNYESTPYGKEPYGDNFSEIWDSDTNGLFYIEKKEVDNPSF